MAALLALAAAIGWGSSDFAAGIASRRSSAVSVVVLTHLASVVTLVGVSFGHSGSPTPRDLMWGAGAGLSGGLGAMFLYRGLARGAMAVVAPITAAVAAVMPAVFGLATGEPLSRIAQMGLVLALASIVLVSMSAPEAPAAASETPAEPIAADAPRQGILPLPVAPSPARRPFVSPQQLPHTVLPFLALCFVAAPFGGERAAQRSLIGGAWFNGQFLGLVGLTVAIVLGSMYAVTWALEGPGITSGGRATVASIRPVRRPRRSAGNGMVDAVLSGVGFGAFYVLLGRTGAQAGNWPLVAARLTSVVCFAAAAVMTRGALLPARGTRRAVVAAGVLDAAAAVLFVAATRSGLLSVSAVLSSMYPGVTVLLARAVTKERCTRVQLAGLAVAGVAVALLAAF